MIPFDIVHENMEHAAILDNTYKVLDTIGIGRYAKYQHNNNNN